MEDWIMAQGWLSWSEGYVWVWLVLAVLILAAITNVVVAHTLDVAERQAEKTVNLWDDSLIYALRKPVRVSVWVVAVILSVDIVEKSSESKAVSSVLDYIQPERYALFVVVFICWFALRFIKQAEKVLVDPSRLSKPMDLTTVHALGKAMKAVVFIIGALVILQTLGISVSGLLAFGGVGGIAVGFAAKDLLANFFGGLMIYLDRPFKVGDWIRSPDKNIEGTVEDIGWRLTRIRTFDKRPLYVPNSTFANISVENPSRMLNRRIYETIGLRYQDAKVVPHVVQEVKEMLKHHPDIDTKQTLIVNFNSFGAHSMDFFIYTFTKTTDWIEYHQVKEKVLLQVMEIVHKHGADMAFPTQTLHLEGDLLNQMSGRS
ncbi:mechanosensitive ion channel protein MscS [Litoribrevibacter albus]|uniref:Mechanosensitive ion channel protein MscS n=2 Tax=Litoribrevibacter albus TaxID=1473156 RepID=A0AA37S6U1_9GAMM|nr:mechanosensitive ion channel protein MscS [Litoribrevibacter albus]